MLEYIRLNQSKLSDATESYDLHINALKHPKYYPSLIQDRLCSLATKEDYSKIPAYLNDAYKLADIPKEQRRKQKGYPPPLRLSQIVENRHVLRNLQQVQLPRLVRSYTPQKWYHSPPSEPSSVEVISEVENRYVLGIFNKFASDR